MSKFANKAVKEFEKFNEECLCLLPDQKSDVIDWLRKKIAELEAK